MSKSGKGHANLLPVLPLDLRLINFLNLFQNYYSFGTLPSVGNLQTCNHQKNSI